jgi:hypothetical protein
MTPRTRFLTVPLQFLIVSLDAPAQLGEIDQFGEGNTRKQCGEPILSWLRRALRPLDQQPFLFSRFLEPLIAVRGPHAQAGITRGEPVGRALALGDRLPGRLGQAEGERLTTPPTDGT